MSNLFKRAGLAILGLVAVLAYWSLRGGDSDSKASEDPVAGVGRRRRDARH